MNKEKNSKQKLQLKTVIRFLFLYCSLFIIHCSLFSQNLWYKQPALKWTEALPIGNGNLGAMIFGDVQEDHLQFNENTLWTGRPRNYNKQNAYKYLPQIRALLAQGKQKEAEALAGKEFMGLKDVDDSVYATNRKLWLSTVTQENKFANTNFNDSGWQKMQIPTVNGWEQTGLDGLDGSVWFRTTFYLPENMLGHELVIDLGRIRDLDFTYINGNFIGTTEGNSAKRTYTIKAQFLHEGQNCLAIQVINFFDKGGFTGIKEAKKTLVVYPKNHSEQAIQLPTQWKYFVANSNPPQFPQYQGAYQPFGDIFFTFKHDTDYTNYTRTLNIGQSISTVNYTCNNVDYARTYFASNPNNIIAAHFVANKKGSISVAAKFNSVHKNYSVTKINSNTIALNVQVKNGALKGTAYLYVKAINGSVNIVNNSITITNADEAIFYLAAATNFINYQNTSGNATEKCKQTIATATKISYASLKQMHVQDYQNLYNKFSIWLGNDDNKNIPTDERLKKFTPLTDNYLAALYVQYSRYLLLSCSRQNSQQPANLQGLWNNLLTPPWGSKYTTNINLQMNYWSANLLNLSNCTAPLFYKLQQLSIAGTQTAKQYYNANGWVLHHNTDLWNGTAPINASNHGIWITGAAWLSNMIWEQYLYTQDKIFLQKNYPVLQSAAQFFLDFLLKDSTTNWLISTPTNSPENGGLVQGATMDHQIIRSLLQNANAAAKILNNLSNLTNQFLLAAQKIAPNKIGKYGQLQEWITDIDDTSNKHRHVSHLWGVYPGNEITWNDSATMQAAKQSLLYRGDDGTGWSLAWKINLWARFKQGNHAMLMVQKLLSPADDDVATSEKGGVYKNLFDAHPPFQIDGNFGGAAGIIEMLMQSHMNTIDLLPALPNALPNGKIEGLCAKGGFEINMQWSQNNLQWTTITSKSGNICNVTYNNKKVSFTTQKNKTYKLNSNLQLVQ